MRHVDARIGVHAVSAADLRYPLCAQFTLDRGPPTLLHQARNQRVLVVVAGPYEHPYQAVLLEERPGGYAGQQLEQHERRNGFEVVKSLRRIKGNVCRYEKGIVPLRRLASAEDL